MKMGDEVVVIGPIYHLVSSTNLEGKTGVIDDITINDDFKVEFPENTIRGINISVTLIIRRSNLVLKSLYPFYQSGIAKLTKEERKALGV